MLRNALRFAAGAVAGALLWWYATPQYNAVVGAAAAQLLRLDHRLYDIDAAERGRWVLLRSASGTFGIATIPAEQITYNVILFAALVATVRRPSWRRLAIAVAILFASHVVTFAVATESTYANGRDPAAAEANSWMMAQLFLRVVGMLAVAFGCWWWVAARSMQRPGVHERSPLSRGSRRGGSGDSRAG